MNDKELKLLITLLKDIDKFGIDTFLSLSEKIKNSGLPNLGILKEENIASLHGKTKVNYNNKMMKVVSSLPPDYQDRITDLIKIIKSKEKIKNLAAFSRFFNLNGIEINKISSWDAGIYSLVLILKDKDINFINNLVFEDESKKIDDRSLDGWSNIIMNKEDER